MNSTFKEENLAKIEDGSKKFKEHNDNLQILARPITSAQVRKVQETVQNLFMHVKEGIVFHKMSWA